MFYAYALRSKHADRPKTYVCLPDFAGWELARAIDSDLGCVRAWASLLYEKLGPGLGIVICYKCQPFDTGIYRYIGTMFSIVTSSIMPTTAIAVSRCVRYVRLEVALNT